MNILHKQSGADKKNMQKIKNKQTWIYLTHPFEGENPASSCDAQQDIEGASWTPWHHMRRALTHSVDHGEATQRLHHLDDRLLFPNKTDCAWG